MTERRSDNEMAFAGIILFAIGVAVIVSLNSLPIYSTSAIFLLGLIAGGLVATGLVLILRSNSRRAMP